MRLRKEKRGKTLRTEELYKRYGRKEVVKGVSISLHRGEIVGLLGPNGAGKTTTFYMIMGLVAPTHGRIYLDDVDITRYPVYRRARLGIGYLAQEPSIFRKLSVLDNLLLVLEANGVPRRQRLEIAEKTLEEMGILHLKRQLGVHLSGGERRRVEIARALVLDPAFLLLDEPFTGIDPIAVQELQDMVMHLRETRDIGILITDHNVRETMEITDRLYIMHKGKILIHGSPDEIKKNETAKKYYLGNKFDALP